MMVSNALDTFEQLIRWDESGIKHMLIGKPLVNFKHSRTMPETLVCHDMKGGYLNEEHIDGCELENSTSPYILFHWWYVDIFVYFSHHLITIPPVVWINQAHEHGVLVLGTLITEWDGGEKVCKQIFHDAESVNLVVKKLVAVATTYNFDGWLINIENKIEKPNLVFLDLFLVELTKEMRNAIGNRSRVIWYDAVTVDGELKWQNELNEKNKRWFDITDGIFLNYSWKSEKLAASSMRSKSRQWDVYVGVDCYGRGCQYAGGWTCHEAFSSARDNNLSVALFAPGWIAETMPNGNPILNSMRFWDRLIADVYPHRLTVLPINTSFGFGFQKNCNKLYNMSTFELQPHFLASGVLIQLDESSLLLPGPGSYKLFETHLILDGTYGAEVDSDQMVELVLWKIQDGQRSSLEIKKRESVNGNKWRFSLENQSIYAIGLSTKHPAKLRVFHFERCKNSRRTILPNLEC